jgi:hypothetical protein
VSGVVRRADCKKNNILYFKLLQHFKAGHLSKWHIQLRFLSHRDGVLHLKEQFFFIFYCEVIAAYFETLDTLCEENTKLVILIVGICVVTLGL